MRYTETRVEQGFFFATVLHGVRKSCNQLTTKIASGCIDKLIYINLHVKKLALCNWSLVMLNGNNFNQ